MFVKKVDLNMNVPVEPGSISFFFMSEYHHLRRFMPLKQPLRSVE